MAGTSGDTGQPNVHAAWRMAQAAMAARAYQPNPKLAALAVGGSVGSGLADQFSDLELDCYWFSAPGDSDRAGPINALGGHLTALWDYDQDDEEWSEDYRLGELDVTVSNFLTGHTRLKWQRHLIAGLEVAPDRLAERLGLLSAARHTEALQAAEALLTDIVLLAEAHTRADLAAFREELAGCRRAIGPPPG